MSSGSLMRPEPSLNPTPNPTHGYSLQALIITSVLVFLAAGAVILILALNSNSNSSPDQDTAPNTAPAPDTQQTATDLPPPCAGVEIYDPATAARNETGVHIGTNHAGSGIGCIPVCVVDHNPLDATLTPNELRFSRGSELPPETKTIGEIKPLLPPDWRDRVPELLDEVELEVPFLLADGEVQNGQVVVFLTLSPLLESLARTELSLPPEVPLNTVPVPVDPRIARVAVAPTQNQCVAYDAAGEPLLS